MLLKDDDDADQPPAKRVRTLYEPAEEEDEDGDGDDDDDDVESEPDFDENEGLATTAKGGVVHYVSTRTTYANRSI